MGFSKWIGATIGWSFGGPIGAIIGMAEVVLYKDKGKMKIQKRFKIVSKRIGIVHFKKEYLKI